LEDFIMALSMSDFTNSPADGELDLYMGNNLVKSSSILSSIFKTPFFTLSLALK